MAKKHALLISAGPYEHHEHFTPLNKTTSDVEGLAEVLRAENFTVEPLVDGKHYTVKAAVQKFYKDRSRDDLLLLYFSGHGVRNEDGELYLPLVDSDPEAVEETSVDCSRLRRYMNRSSSKRQLLILDCCHSAAFDHTKDVANAVDEVTRQLQPDADATFDPAQQQGRFVITATGATSLAFEREEGDPKLPHSVFTAALIEGLKHQPATDAQGHVTVNSLFQHLRQTVPDKTDGKQKPQLISYAGDGDLVIVKSARTPLPGQTLDLLNNSDPDQRVLGIVQLKHHCLRRPESVSEVLSRLARFVEDRDSIVQAEARQVADYLREKFSVGAAQLTDERKPAPVKQAPKTNSQNKIQPIDFSPGKVFQDSLKVGGLGPKMVVIPGGEFMMGSPESEEGRHESEGPQHRVTIPLFALGQTAVTFDDYEKFVKHTTAKLPDDEGWGKGRRPVINVSWEDAVAYAKWLSEQTGEDYRLPSEAEWEYAARAGTTTPYHTGKRIRHDQANFNEKKGRTVEVATYPANDFGLFDMHGNVWEWVADYWHVDYENAPTNHEPWLEANGGDSEGRVLRGGSWLYFSVDLRSAYRFDYAPSNRLSDAGFRLARTLRK